MRTIPRILTTTALCLAAGNNAQNTTRKTMTRTRQTKGSTSSKSSPCSPFFTPSATKMQKTRNKMLV